MAKNDKDAEVINLEDKKRELFEKLERGQHDVKSSIEDNPFLTKMNENHAFINSVGGRPMVLCKVYNAAFEKEIYEFRSPDAIQVQYSNQSVMVGTSHVPLGKWWLQHSERREYDTAIFDPDRPQVFNNCFNLYEGLAITPERGVWKRTLRHLYRILSNGDREKFIYLLKWLAWTMQNPGKRAEIVVILKGKQGAGKGFIFSQFVKIFGSSGLHISNRKHLTGQFNGHMARCVFMFADEAYYPGDKEVEGTLNQLISEEKIGIEHKGKDLVIGKNCLHIAMATNAEWVIPAGGDTRRYYINEVDNRYAKNETSDDEREDYFTELWGEMNNGGREAMAYDLLNMDLRDWHPRYNMPLTDEFKKQVYLGSSREDKVLKELLDSGEFPGAKLPTEPYWQCTHAGIRKFFDSRWTGRQRYDEEKIKRTLHAMGVISDRRPKGLYWKFKNLQQTREAFSQVIMGAEFKEDTTAEWMDLGEDY